MGQMVLHKSEAADGEVLHLPESGCRVRAGHATRGRPALEAYADGGLYDVAVADSLGSNLIRGAVRGREHDYARSRDGLSDSLSG
jgi:hypothetical protein